MKRILLCATLPLLLLLARAQAGEKGWFGVRLQVETKGFVLNPTLRAVRLREVVPNSPAAAQDLRAGDEVVEAEGKMVVGSNGREMQVLMTKQPGEVLHLRLKRSSGEIYSANLTAIKKPAS